MEENKEVNKIEEPKESPWKGYKPKKGVTPPWDPFNPEKRKKRMTMSEKKFLYVLSSTGNMSEAYRAAYKHRVLPDKRMDNARVYAMANQILERVRRKFPLEVSQMLFEDITPDFVRRELMNLFKNEGSTVGEKTRIIELMGKIHGMFTDKQIVESRIKDLVKDIYQETDDDMPMHDSRLSRIEIDENIGKA
ncbi:MAG: hypothetical protein AABW93_03170 [Nanoarchaeota archaeon]